MFLNRFFYLKCFNVPIRCIFSLSPGKKEHSSRKEETKKDQKAKNKNKEQDSKFPATDGVNLEYFLSELSDDDNSSW